MARRTEDFVKNFRYGFLFKASVRSGSVLSCATGASGSGESLKLDNFPCWIKLASLVYGVLNIRLRVYLS